MSTFGSIQLKDATAEFEKMVEEIAEWAEEQVNQVGPTILNRPPGSKPLSKEEDHQDWMDAMMNPALLQEMFDSLASVYGVENAALEILAWDKEHMKMHEEMANGPTA